MLHMFRVSIGLLAVFAFLAGQAQAQVQTGSILVKATDEQGAVMPGVTVTISSPVLVAGQTTGVTDAGGVISLPVARARHVHGQARARRLPDDRPREHRRARRPDDPARLRDEGRERRRNGHRHRRVADRRHDERERQRQPERAADSGHAGRPRHLGAASKHKCRAW